MRLDETTFFTYARRAPFGGRLSTEQVSGMTDLLSEWDRQGHSDVRWLAYILAGVFHETGGRMVPVREGFAKSDAAARKIVAKRKYGKPAGPYGRVYYGIGRIQNTWLENMQKLTKRFGIDFVKNPERLLESKIDAEVTIVGHVEGIWTGLRLSQFFNASADDPKGARKIVNGTDKASLIAGYYEQFLGAIKAANTATPAPADVSAEEARPDDVQPHKSKSILTIAASAIGATGTSLITAINNPWAFGAVAFIAVIVGVGAWLFFTGRIEIKRSHAI